MKSVAVVGDEDFLLGFRLAGVRNTYNTGGDVEDTLRDLLEHDEYGIVVVDDATVEEVPSRLRESINESVDPVFVKIGEDVSGLRGKIQQAIGVDLWQEGDTQ